MFRRANENTHQACRSLLQKAVRRGDAQLARRVIAHLDEVGDKTWLKQRAVVITFEECWPLASELYYPLKVVDISEHLSTVSNSIKEKNAAGLGSLAYAFSEGDESAIEKPEDDQAIRIIASAIKRPEDYWNWAISQCDTEKKEKKLRNFQSAYKKCGWPWDKAFVLAAGFLAITDSTPKIKIASQETNIGRFPFWVALDKHTPQGKIGLNTAAKALKLPVRQVMWSSFYFESAKTNQSHEAYWWDREKEWRLMRTGLDITSANKLWERVRPVFIEIMSEEAKRLEEHIYESELPIQHKLL